MTPGKLNKYLELKVMPQEHLWQILLVQLAEIESLIFAEEL